MSGLEEWRPVVGHEGAYEVSNLGRVRSLDREWPQLSRHGTYYTHRKKGMLLRPGPSTAGHLTVALRRGYSRLVHSLVADAFIGPRPKGREIRHLDGNEKNNAASNLIYGTRAENSQDKKWHKGAANYKLNPLQVLDIKTRLASGERGSVIARDYDVSHSAISAILHKRVHVDV